jgi:hypothetical protein
MRRKGIALLMLAVWLGGTAALMGCEKDDGPAEEVGEAIDNAADEIEDAVDKD